MNHASSPRPRQAAERSALEKCPTCGAPLGRCDCLHDIVNPSAFVHDTIIRARLVLSSEERDELHAEGLAILFKLGRDFRLRMDGYEQDGRFSGFAAWALPKKLGDAWHRMRPEHQHVTQADGTRKWVYGERAVSLEALTAEDPDRHAIMASSQNRSDLRARLHSALVKRSRAEQDWIVDVAKLLGTGTSPADIAVKLGLDEESVRRHMRAIVRAQPKPGHQFTTVSELRAALEAQAEADATLVADVGDLLGEGASVADIAAVLKLEVGEIREHEDAIRRVWHQIESEGA